MRQDYEDAWREVICAKAGARMVTLGFTQVVNSDIAVKCLEHFLVKINRYVYGKRWRKNAMFMEGVVVREWKRLSYAARGSPHYHCLIAESKGSHSVSTDRLRRAAEKAAPRLCVPTMNLYEPFGKLLSGKHYVDVRDVHDPIRLSGYLTKELRYQELGNLGFTVGFIGGEGVTGLTAIDGFRPAFW